jgi:Zn-dependent protease with chaperone function/tetratricopeptide (TPR) repeat protein
MARVFLWGIAGLLVSTVAAASPASRTNAALDLRFRADVERVSAAAATAYDQANAARDAHRDDEAIAAYRKAIALAPNVDHPHRRLCSVLNTANQLDEAIVECEAALALAPDSPYDKTSVATVLAQRKGPGDVDRAVQLSHEAVDALPNDVHTLEAACGVQIQSGSVAGMRECIRRLLAADPEGLSANLFGALAAADDDDLDLARARLRKSKAAGLAQVTFDDLNTKFDAYEESKQTFPRWAHTAFWGGLWLLGTWLGAMVLLLAVGFLLSRLTLRTVNRATAADAAGSQGEHRLRTIYKAVLLLSGVYFYLSIPILLGLIIAAGCGAVLAFWAMGTIPIKLVLIIGLVVFATVGAILRSLFVRSNATPPGDPLELAKEPKLRALLDDVARVAGTRPVDVAYLTPGTDMAVTERGGLWTSLRGTRTERSIIMGVALFDGMTQLQLRSILAHEYGHFRNQDTAGGGFALAVRRSLFTLIIRLAQSGAAGAYNPVWWFLRGYHRVYLGISQGASRLQEVLADRWAIRAYGSAGFIAGYRHVVSRSVQFEHDVNATIKEVVDKRRALPNLYHYVADAERVSASDLATEIEQEMGREPTVYDSHPSPRQRLAWAEQLAVTRDAQPDDDAPVWALFADRDALERAMTSTVRDRVQANHGFKIPEVAEPPAADEAAPAPAEDDGNWKGYSDENTPS